jgi:hypothetical protein
MSSMFSDLNAASMARGTFKDAIRSFLPGRNRGKSLMSDIRLDSLKVSAFRTPTETPQSDGTLEWNYHRC